MSNKRLTNEEFIARATKVHGDKYSYTEVEYQNYTSYLDLNCSIHGKFKVTVGNFLSGKACGKCSRAQMGETKSSSTEEYVKDCKIIHKDLYDYSKTVYRRSFEKIDCNLHYARRFSSNS